MRSLNNPHVTVPGGFKWFNEDLKKWVPPAGSINNYNEFIHRCKQFCQANQLPIGSQWEQAIQHQLCAGLDGNWCQEGGWPVPPIGGWGFTLEAVVQGSHKLAQKMIQAKARRVPADESIVRAAICIDCPFNQSPVGCTSCASAAMNAAAGMVDGAAAINDPRLRSCKISGLSLAAKINVPQTILLDLLTREQKQALPERCWLNGV